MRGSVDGRTRSGRFIRAMVADLEKHVGGAPSVTERLVIGRIARIWMQLELLDGKIAAGECNDHDRRVHGALNNTLRLLIREIGLKPTAAKPISLADRLRTAQQEGRS